MSHQVSDIRTGIAANVSSNIAGLRSYRVWPGKFNPPGLVVRPIRGAYHQTFGGKVTHRMRLTVAVQQATVGRAQDARDAYLDPSGASSVVAAVESEKTLGGAAEDVAVLSYEVDDAYEINGFPYEAVHFDVEVMA